MTIYNIISEILRQSVTKNKQQKDMGEVSLTACDSIYKYVPRDNLTFTEKKS